MQRFILLLFISIIFCFTAQAQLTKGTRFISTGVSGAGNTFFRTPLAVYGGLGELAVGLGNDDAFFVLQATPDLGYFLSDHVLLGSSFILSTITDFDDSYTTIGAIPFVRYYFNPASTGNTYFYGQAQAGFTTSLDESDFNAYPFALRAGATHLLAPGLGLDTYLQLHDSDLSTDDGSSLAIGATLNIYLNDDMYNNRKTGTTNLQRGTLMIGGTGGGIGFGLGDNKSTAITLEPQMFYFLNPQLAIGSGLQIEINRSEFGLFEITSTNLGISPQLRYYLSTGQHRLWFIGGGLNINYNRLKNDFFNEEPRKETNVDFGIGAGFNSFITPNIAFEIGPSLRIDPDGDLVRIGLDIGIQAFLNTGE
jgi:hypothetical protein